MANAFTRFFAFGILLLSCAFLGNALKATHSMGADLTYACLGPNQYRLTLTLYRDCSGILPLSSYTAYYNSVACGVSNAPVTLNQVGAAVEVTPLCPSAPSSCGGGGGAYGIEEYTFQGVMNLPPGCSDWYVRWYECCRNGAITTLDAPSTQSMQVYARLNNTVAPCNNSPVFSNDPVAIVCVGQPVNFNHGATDADGDVLVYSLTSCIQQGGPTVDYAAGYSASVPLTTASGVSINPTTGQITFTPTILQIGVICVLVEEYRGGVKIGEVVRDMQFSVISCANAPPVATGMNGTADFDTTICVGSNLCFFVNTSDPNANNITMTWNSGIPTGSMVITGSGGTNPAGTFCWTPTAADIGANIFTIRLEDNACLVSGISVFTYTINVIPSPNTLSAGPDVNLCQGSAGTVLTAIGPGATSFTWSPAAGLSCTSCASPTANPTVTTTYTVTANFPSGCNLSDNVTVIIRPKPVVSIAPSSVYSCAGSPVMLTASSPTGVSWLWSTGAVTSSITVSPASTTSYWVQTTDAFGCTARDTATVFINTPAPDVCNVIYASPTGSGTGTQASPASLTNAIAMAGCNNTVIKLAIGTYTLNNPLSIPGFLTLEGGFDPAMSWRKTSAAGATTINRSSANPEGISPQQRLVAIYMNGASNFRFQDLTISTANATGNGMSTYCVHLTNCSNYNFVRVQLLPGNASAGANGVAGATGIAGRNGGNGTAGDIDDQEDAGAGGGGGGGGGTTLGTPGANATGNFASANNCTLTGGAGGTGGATAGNGGTGASDANGCGCCATGTSGLAGATSTNGRSGGGGGGGGSGGEESSNGGPGGQGGGVFGVIGNNTGGGGAGTWGDPGNAGAAGAAGAVGTAGAAGAAGPAGTHTAGFWVPGGPGATGADGRGGQGGRGGGGGGGQYCTFCIDGSGSGGGGGGGGGQGGAGGTGGAGGGSSYAAYLFNNGASASFDDCRLLAGLAGAGGAGGNGGAGGAGGAGGSGSPYNGEVGRGGNGGAGGAGGIGGAGGAGQPGQTIALHQNGGTAPVLADINFNLPGQPTIFMENVSCTFTPITYSTGVSNSWNFGAGSAPPTAIAASAITQYSTTGRKNIIYGGNQYTGFANIILDDNVVPIAGTTAPIIAGEYRICAGSSVNFMSLNPGLGYVYNWNMGGGAVPNTYTGATFVNVNSVVFNTPGVYYITLMYTTDCCGNSPLDSIELHVDPQPVVAIAGGGSFCYGVPPGLTLTASGATSYTWTPSSGLTPTTGAVVTAYPTSTTTYTVIGTNAFGTCNDDATVTVTVNNINLTPNAVNVTCGSNGQASVTVAGGSGSYSYAWSTGATTSSVSGLPSGTYTVTVTDLVTGCTNTTSSFVAPGPGVLTAYPTTVVPVSCFGGSNGTATISITGGVGPTFLYNWAPSGGSASTTTPLPAGTYTVTVFDVGNPGCPTTATVTIPQPADLALALVDTTSTTCLNTPDGAAIVNASGGTGPFSYLWSTIPPQTGPTASGLLPGTYTVTVTDDRGCTETLNVTVAASNPCILPVEYLYFTANPGAGHIRLNWQTTVENESKGFEVQRSEDGLNFDKIGWVDSKAASGSGAAYELKDLRVVPGVTYYYRLRHFDLDGQSSLSEVREARLPENDQIVILTSYPNPIENDLFVEFEIGKGAKLTFDVVTLTGVELGIRQEMELEPGQHKVALRMDEVSAGMYFLRIRMDGQPAGTVKFFKIR